MLIDDKETFRKFGCFSARRLGGTRRRQSMQLLNILPYKESARDKCGLFLTAL